jgi:hypothetical protein
VPVFVNCLVQTLLWSCTVSINTKNVSFFLIYFLNGNLHIASQTHNFIILKKEEIASGFIIVC